MTDARGALFLWRKTCRRENLRHDLAEMWACGVTIGWMVDPMSDLTGFQKCGIRI